MADEIIVGTADSEIAAEIIASRLRAEGIPVRVAYESQSGVPRQIAPSGIGFGPGAFRVAVAGDRADEARAVLADVDPEPERRNPLLRAIALVLLVALVLVWVPGAISAVLALFGSR